MLYKKIVLAYDGSESGRRALLGIKELGQWKRPKLFLLAVIPSGSLDVGAMEMAYVGCESPVDNRTSLKEQLREEINVLRCMGFDVVEGILEGDFIREIIKYAITQEADLIVVGHKREKSLLKRWFSGAIAQSLIENSPCNVLVVTHDDAK